jgi:hypothetical protein
MFSAKARVAPPAVEHTIRDSELLFAKQLGLVNMRRFVEEGFSHSAH